MKCFPSANQQNKRHKIVFAVLTVNFFFLVSRAKPNNNLKIFLPTYLPTYLSNVFFTLETFNILFLAQAAIP